MMLFVGGFELHVIFAEEEPIPSLLKKEQPKNSWDDEDVDDNDVKESWEDEDEPAPVMLITYALLK